MKTIFITGASAGLGRAAVQLFQAKGWKIIATMRNPEKETELGKLENVTLLPLDVTHLAQIHDTVQKAVQLGPIDVVFNNAGYGLVGALEACSDEQITAQLETNLTGVLRVTQAFIPHFKEKRSGCSSPPRRSAGLPPILFPVSTTLPNGRLRAGAKAFPMNWHSSTSISRRWRRAASKAIIGT